LTWILDCLQSVRQAALSTVRPPEHAPPRASGDLQAFPFRRHGWFPVMTLGGLVTLTFDLFIYKWGHGSPVSRASFLQIFSLLPFYSRLRVIGSWQTDREAEGRTDKRVNRQMTAINA